MILVSLPACRNPAATAGRRPGNELVENVRSSGRPAPQTAAATSELNAVFLVVAAAFFGPVVAYALARLLAPALTALSPVGGFLAAANLGAATRRFSSASTPLVLTIALSCTFFFGSTTIEHATSQQQRAALTGQLAVTSAGPGLPAAALADTRATPGVRSEVVRYC